MDGHQTVAVFFSVFVDFLLIMGVNRLTGNPYGAVRGMAGAVITGVYAAGCMLPQLRFLQGGLWYLAAVAACCGVSFGLQRGLGRWGLFLLLRLALGGMTAWEGSALSAVLGTAGCVAMGAVGLRMLLREEKYLPVELVHGGRRWQFTALRDTGNTLRDPVTGEQVMVAGAGMAQQLLGLSAQQLADPAATLAAGAAPGMRLIPYRTVDRQGAMLLAMRLNEVKVGNWRGSALLAFAPARMEGRFDLLVGGRME